MIRYIIRRLLLMIPTVIAITVLSFIIIQAPPGDYLDAYVAQLRALDQIIDDAEVESLRIRYGLGQPMYVQYFKWIGGLLRGDLGRSMQWNQPVSRVLAERLPWSVLISLVSLLFVYAVAIPIGTTSATHQYSIRDYVFTFFGFIGIAIPNFLFALILLYLYFVYTGDVVLGLFSPQFQFAPWSLAKFLDMLQHLWIPAVVIGSAGTCGLIRVMRANLLDELQKPYVLVARAKGLTKRRVLYKYPFRIAINPVVSTIGWVLPALVSGEVLVSLVLGLPTIGPVLFQSLLSQDMLLAGSIVFILSVLTVIGTLISDILLAWLDPRIKESI